MTLPATKSNRRALPPGADPTQYIRAEDVNGLTDAIQTEMAARTAADQAIIAAGVPVALSGSSFVTASGSTTARTLATRFSDVVNVKDFGAVGDGITDDTTAIQAAINAATNGQTIFLPVGTYSVTGVTLPASPPVSMAGGSGVLLKARAGATAVISIAGDISRSGFRSIRDLKITGLGVTGVTGILVGNSTSATLQVYIDNVDIRSCAIGVDLYGSMENALRNTTVYGNVIGLKLRQDVTRGGGNANSFVRFQAQSNTIGVFYDGVSPYPMQANVFSSCLFQSNTLSAFAAFSAEGALLIDGAHFEDNGTAGTSSVVDGRTVYQAPVVLDAASMTLRGSILSENSVIVFRMSNGSGLELDNSSGNGNTVAQVVLDDGTGRVRLRGDIALTGTIAGFVEEWATVDPFVQRLSMYGTPLLLEDPTVVSDFASVGDGDLPALLNANGGAVVTDAMDGTFGPVSHVKFAANAGSTGTNRVTVNAFPSGVAAGDCWLLSFLVRSSSSSSLIADIENGSYARILLPVSVSWTRVVMAFYASFGGLSPVLYLYPGGTDGPDIYMTKLMSVRVPSGGDTDIIRRTARHGLYSPTARRFNFHYSAAPTTGTWRVGDYVRNSAPAVGQPKGWICTVAGTPGTWVSEGNL